MGSRYRRVIRYEIIPEKYSITKILLEAGQFSDIKFLVGPDKSEMLAHKLILVASSPVFATKLENGNSVISEIELPSIGEEEFKVFLIFIYTDVFTNAISIQNVLKVLALALEYDIPRLAEKCSDFAKRRLNYVNCIEIHQRAHELGQDDLEQSAISYMVMLPRLIINYSSFFYNESIYFNSIHII